MNPGKNAKPTLGSLFKSGISQIEAYSFAENGATKQIRKQLKNT